ncbi:hypothetical protein [Chamaesiphon sp. OTE_20_metabat_361]|uniref:hypothetical protein n=1 Tax=Chamaesiphon sp. OTE_20_metabat_361 TaxID=2964689 RepID=UPI00286C9D42|nr:hypothetical protein [Chamaesiphon sp. OTE_20_metabat_361]
MADTNHIPDRTLNLTAEELQIVGYFVRGQKHSLSSPNLKLEYTETSIRLSDCQGKLIGISKQVNQWQRKVLIANSSEYRQPIVSALTELGFIDRQKSSHPEFTEHHYYQLPESYKLNYTETIELWKVWWNNKRYQLNLPKPPIDVLTFTKGNWYLIRDLQPKQGTFIIRTERGEIAIEPDEYIVWIDAIVITHSDSLPLTPLPSSASISTLSAQLDNDRDTDGQDREEIDLESYLNTFNTEDTEDIDRIEGIYNINELLSGNQVFEDILPPEPAPQPADVTPPVPVAEPAPSVAPPVAPAATVEVSVAPPVAPAASVEPSVAAPVAPAASVEVSVAPPTSVPTLSISQRQAALRDKAMQVLASYLENGDRITHTEILKNGQGQELNRKIVNIQRGCPSWAIEQIAQLRSHQF